MEKKTREKFDHVYSRDIHSAISKAISIIKSNKIIESNSIRFIAYDYKVVREKTDIITTIFYKEK